MAELDLASLVVSVRADVRDAATGIDNLNSKIDTIGKTTDQLGSDTARVQKEMSEGWVGLNAQLQAFNELASSIGKPLLGFFKNAVEGASDLQETVSKTNIVFKDYAGDVLEWSESATKTMGLSKESALSMAASFGDLATSMGLATSTSQSMAMNLTQLAADLASFKNIDAQQAFTALQGIFTGNAQALKGLGIVMNETTLEAYAMSQGITTSYQSMSESEKVALRYQYVLAQTANAQGDFARTSDGYANATRSLSESFSELTSSLGEMLLPALETVIGVITDIVQFINDMPNGIKAIIVALGVAGTAMTVLIPIIGKATAAFTALKAAMMTSPLGWVAGIAGAIAGIAAIVSSFASANRKSEKEAEEIKKKVQEIKGQLSSIDGDHPVNYTITVGANTEEADQRFTDIADTYSGTITNLENELTNLITTYNAQNLTIPAGIAATALDMSGIPEDQKKISGITAEADKIPLDYDPDASFVDFAEYYDTNLKELKIALNKGDKNTALDAAANLIASLENIPITIDSEQEAELAQKFLQWRAEALAALKGLVAEIDSIDDSQINYKKLNETLTTNLNNALLVATIDAYEESEDSWSTFENGWKSLEHSLTAFVALQQDPNDTNTKEALALLDKVQAYNNQTFTATAHTEISDDDISKLQSYTQQMIALVGTSKGAWGYKIERDIKKVQRALYKDATGKDSSGSLLQDILDIKEQINAGWGESGAWNDFHDNVIKAIADTKSWEDQIKAVQTALNDTLNAEIESQQAVLRGRIANAWEEMYQAELAGDTEAYRLAEKAAAQAENQLNQTTEYAKQLAETDFGGGYEGYKKQRELGKAANIDISEGKEKGTAKEQGALQTTNAASALGADLLDIKDTADALHEAVINLPEIKYENPENDKKLQQAIDNWNEALPDYMTTWYDLAQMAGLPELRAELDDINAQLEEDPENEALLNAQRETQAKIDEAAEQISLGLEGMSISKEMDEYAQQIGELKYIIPTKDVLTKALQFEGAGGYETRQQVVNALNGLADELATTTDPDAIAFIKQEIADATKILQRFDAKAFADYILNGNQLSEDIINSLDEEGKAIWEMLNQYAEQAGKTDDPQYWGLVGNLFANMLGLNTGATASPLGEGGDTYENPQYFYGNVQNGNNSYDQRQITVIAKTNANLESEESLITWLDEETGNSITGG